MSRIRFVAISETDDEEFFDAREDFYDVSDTETNSLTSNSCTCSRESGSCYHQPQPKKVASNSCSCCGSQPKKVTSSSRSRSSSCQPQRKMVTSSSCSSSYVPQPKKIEGKSKECGVSTLQKVTAWLTAAMDRAKAPIVACENASFACGWEGTTGCLKEHLSKCQFRLIPCPNRCTIPARTNRSKSRITEKVRKIIKRDLARHLETECPNRNHMCRYCGKTGKYEFILKSHEHTCPEKVVGCANYDCLHTLQRQGMKRHLQSCFHTMVPCKYAKLGCQMKVKRKDMPKHEEDTKVHLQMVLDSAMKLHKENTNLKRRLSRIEGCSQPTIRFTGYSGKKRAGTAFVSPCFYTSSPAGYHMSISVLPKGYCDSDCNEETCLSVFVNIKKGVNDKDLEWPFVGYVTIILLDQLKSRNHFKRTLHFDRADSMEVGSSHMCQHFIHHSKLMNSSVNNAQYLKDDTLYFTVLTDILNPNKSRDLLSLRGSCKDS